MSFPCPSLILLLQSNDVIAQSVAGGGTLKPDLTSYTGMLGSFAAMFLLAIQTYGGVLGNYGAAIIATCVTLRVMLLPLTRMQIQGMKLMQALQPVQKAVTHYYPDKNDQNAKMMELYQQYRINPLAGCLPMLIQMPILFGVYRALYDPSFAGHHFLGIQLLFPVNLTAMRNLSLGPDSADLIDTTIAALDLHHQVWHIPANIPFIGDSYWYLPALVLVALYAASSLYMQRVMKKVNAPDPHFAEEFKQEIKLPEKDGQPDLAAQMQRQMGLMNVMIILIAFILSSGAMIYFVIQNLLMCLEYIFISRTVPQHFDAKEMAAFIRKAPPPLPGRGPAGTSKPVEPKPSKGPQDSPGAGKGAASGNDDILSGQAAKPKPKKRKR